MTKLTEEEMIDRLAVIGAKATLTHPGEDLYFEYAGVEYVFRRKGRKGERE